MTVMPHCPPALDRPDLSVILVAAHHRGSLADALASIAHAPAGKTLAEKAPQQEIPVLEIPLLEIIVVEASPGAVKHCNLGHVHTSLLVLPAAPDERRADAGPVDDATMQAAWNRGIAAAKGQLVAFLDPVDRWLPGHLAAHLALHREYPAIGFSFCDRATFGETPHAAGAAFAQSPRFSRRHAPLRTPFMLSDDAFAQLFAEKTVAISTVVARTDAVRRAGGLDAELPIAAAWDLWLRLAGDAPVGCIPARLVQEAVPPHVPAADHLARNLVEMLLIAARHGEAARHIDRAAIRAFQAELLHIRAAIALSASPGWALPWLRARFLRLWAWVHAAPDRVRAPPALPPRSRQTSALLAACLAICCAIYAI